MNRRVIAVDIDGTLLDDKELPLENRIKAINKLHEQGDFIVMFTTRPNKRRYETEYTLRRYGVKYDMLEMEKLHFDVYVDEKKMIQSIEELAKEAKHK